MKKSLLPLLLIFILPGCLNFKGKKRQTKPIKKSQVILNKQKPNTQKDIDFILEDDINDTDPYLAKKSPKLAVANEADSHSIDDGMLEKKLDVVHFEYDKSDVKNSEKEIINNNIAEIKKNLKSNPELTVLVEGHSCLIAKNQEYNHMLSQERANKVATFLKNSGIPKENIKTIGRGTTKTLYTDLNEDQQSPNRRVETSILDI
jgi:outer membrane protein OmpA-like peptidoglycan-associated protein